MKNRIKKRFLPFVIVAVVACMLFSGCSSVPENAVTPPFFKVTDAETGGCVYILGTMHTGLANTVYPDSVMNAFSECGTLAVEVDLVALDSDSKQLSEAMALLKCTDKSTKEMLGDDYEKVRDFFKQKRLYNTLYEEYIPVVWSSAISNKLAEECGYSSQYGTDRYFTALAKQQNKEVYEIESVYEQYQMNAAEPESIQTYMLLSAVDTDWEIQKSEIEKLYLAWSSGDIAALEAALNAEQIPQDSASDYEEFYYAMYENRQRKMADYIKTELENGNKTFVAIGALHLAAYPDVIDLIQDSGYTVLES